MLDGWKYSNYGLISIVPPHKDAQLNLIDNWKTKGVGGVRPLYIQYTSDFDCGQETEWWYCIKDDIFDLSELKSKRRYEINKGLKNFEARRITPLDYISEINEIRDKLFAQYPEEYRIKNNPSNVINSYRNRTGEWISIGAFQDGKLRGYLDAEVKDGYIDFTRLCVDPEYEKQGINFVLVFMLLSECKSFIERGFYICDGARTIRHKTSFQDWLEKYFGFRKAYCKLNIDCKSFIGVLISIIRPLTVHSDNIHNSKLYNLVCFAKLYYIAKG